MLGREDYVGIDVGDELPVSIQGVYPIHQSERAFIHEHGLEAFWNRDWDPYDVTRAPGRVSRLHDAYRRTGADLPFGDPRRAHGVAMEGYYWRLSDPASGRCVIALCGVCRARGRAGPLGRRGARRPPRRLRALARPRTAAAADDAALGAAAWEAGGAPVLRGSERRIAVDLGPGARLEAVLEGRDEWPRRALGGLGIAQAAPGLPQYWHPVVLGARVRGEAMLGGETVSLDGWDAYVEKNWGGTFPGEWWWGQAALERGSDGGLRGGPARAGRSPRARSWCARAASSPASACPAAS